jgi:hypothetical protein
MSSSLYDDVERQYPGFRETVAYWEAQELPSCSRCGSQYTARVSAGLVGRSMRLSGATRKIHLIPNGHPADFWCNSCRRYFDSWGSVAIVEGLQVIVNRPERWRSGAVACFVLVANPSKKPLPWYLRELHLLDGDGKRYDETDEATELGRVTSVATRVDPHSLIQGYVTFALPKEAYASKVIHGHVSTPTATWQN